MKSKNYNGWKNRATWNVALWINNDESLYNEAIEFMKRQQKNKRQLYKRFIYGMGFEHSSTPDGIGWLSHKLSLSELNQFMKELIE